MSAAAITFLSLGISSCAKQTVPIGCSVNQDCQQGQQCVAGECVPRDPDKPDLATSIDMATPPDLLRAPGPLLHAWARRFGSNGQDLGTGVAFAPGGDVILAASYASSFDLDGQTQQAPNLLITRLDRVTGARKWAKSIATSLGYTMYRPDNLTQQSLLHVTTDNNGDVIVAVFAQSMDCGDGRPLKEAGSGDTFLVKLKGDDGNCLWSRGFGGPSTDRVYGVATNKDRDIYLVGAYNGEIVFGGQTFPNNGLVDVYVARYDTGGNARQLLRFGSSEGDFGLGIAVDGADNVVVTGTYGKGITVGGTTLSNAGQTDIFLVKPPKDLSAPLWAKSFGGPLVDEGIGVAASATGEIALTGAFRGAADFNRDKPATTVLGSAGDADAFVASLQGDGTLRWARRLGGAEQDEGRAVAFDPFGNILLAGVFRGSVEFLPGRTITAQERDIFLMRLHMTAADSLLFTYGAIGQDEVWGLAANAREEVALAGLTNAPVLTIEGKNYNSAGGMDILALKLRPMNELPE
jgi:hypothetical protein